MKKIITSLLLSLTILLSPGLTASNAASGQHTILANSNASANNQRDAMIKRVYEIRDMNFATLSTAQKRDLTNELMGIRKNMNGPDDFTGLYLTSGVIIIILIVLLILALGKH